jgi:hypothetical protein
MIGRGYSEVVANMSIGMDARHLFSKRSIPTAGHFDRV